MLRVELGTPRLLWGVHPSSSAMAPVVGLVCGDLGAFGLGVFTDSVRLCSRWFPVPMENEDETKTHLHVGCQGERGMTGASPQP